MPVGLQPLYFRALPARDAVFSWLAYQSRQTIR